MCQRLNVARNPIRMDCEVSEHLSLFITQVRTRDYDILARWPLIHIEHFALSKTDLRHPRSGSQSCPRIVSLLSAGAASNAVIACTAISSLSLSPSMMHVSRLYYVVQHSDFNAMTNIPQSSKKRSRSSDWYALRNHTLVMMWYRCDIT